MTTSAPTLSRNPLRAAPGDRPRRRRQPSPNIEVRRMNLAFDPQVRRFWYADNAILTAFMAALSSSFPPGEREFVRSVLHYRDQLDGELLEQVRAFAAQEGQHARQHEGANAWLDSLGLDTKTCTQALVTEIEEFRKNTPDDVLLAATVGAEHITAIMAHYLLTHPSILEAVPDSVRELLYWHAVEEIEHKAVAMDVYNTVSGDRNKLRLTFMAQTVAFSTMLYRCTRYMLKKADYTPTPREWAEAARFLLGADGLIPGIAKSYVSFYRKDFHPWDHDDSHLIEAWKTSQLASAAA